MSLVMPSTRDCHYDALGTKIDIWFTPKRISECIPNSNFSTNQDNQNHPDDKNESNHPAKNKYVQSQQ